MKLWRPIELHSRFLETKDRNEFWTWSQETNPWRTTRKENIVLSSWKVRMETCSEPRNKFLFRNKEPRSKFWFRIKEPWSKFLSKNNRSRNNVQQPSWKRGSYDKKSNQRPWGGGQVKQWRQTKLNPRPQKSELKLSYGSVFWTQGQESNLGFKVRSQQVIIDKLKLKNGNKVRRESPWRPKKLIKPNQIAS